MDLLVAEADLRLAMSEFANLITVAKFGIISLENDVRRYKDKYLKRLNDKRLGRSLHTFHVENNVPNVAVDEQFDLWMTKLQKYLKEVEFFGRAASLRVFARFINYLYIPRTPMTLQDRELQLPVCNITFPWDKMKLESSKCFVKTNKCRKQCKMYN